MGAGNSKPGSSTQHVFSSDTPIQFSQELVDSLQASSETNSTRAKSLDLHIQQRVAAELEKIQKHETETLNALREKLAKESSSSPPSDSNADKSKSKPKSSFLSLPDLSISPKDLLPKSTESKEEEARKSQSSAKVQQEIEKLKSQLGQRKQVKELPKEVEKARESVIGCLRVNDRRPLDCWKEVDAFKREVRKLEEQFVGDVL